MKGLLPRMKYLQVYGSACAILAGKQLLWLIEDIQTKEMVLVIDIYDFVKSLDINATDWLCILVPLPQMNNPNVNKLILLYMSLPDFF
jgi:hypothetical protein